MQFGVSLGVKLGHMQKWSRMAARQPSCEWPQKIAGLNIEQIEIKGLIVANNECSTIKTVCLLKDETPP